MTDNLPNLPQPEGVIPDTQTQNAPDVPEAPVNPEPAMVLNANGQESSKPGGKKMIATIFGLAVVAVLSGGVFMATKLTQQPQEAAPSEAAQMNDGDIQVKGRTIYVKVGDGKEGKKKVKKIKNKATWRAMKAKANSNGKSVTEEYSDITTVDAFNKQVYKDLIKNQVYSGKIERFTYKEYVCDTPGQVEGSGCWQEREYTADEMWKYISETIAGGNIYFCPDGFASKTVCNSGELSTGLSPETVFDYLTGSGQSDKEMCGFFQGDVNYSGEKEKAKKGDKILGFALPCEGKDEVTDGGDEEDQFYSCDSLSMSKKNIELNDTVTFSCEGSFSGYSPLAYFRYSSDGGTTFTNEDIAHSLVEENPASMDLTIDKYGSWVVQCRVCTDETNTDCTDWNSTAK